MLDRLRTYAAKVSSVFILSTASCSISSDYYDNSQFAEAIARNVGSRMVCDNNYDVVVVIEPRGSGNTVSARGNC